MRWSYWAGGGAAAEGSDDCAGCHEDLSLAFRVTTHGRIASFEVQDGQTGCVTCHGDGTEHIDSGGDPTLIRTFSAETPPGEKSDVCMTCHRSGELNDWVGSLHQMSDVGCSDCHRVHATK